MTADARLLLMNAAEQLIAQHGYAALSLRQVGVVAGQRNNSAAQYHFGTKDALLEAIITTRSERGEQRRRQLLADLDPERVTVRAVVEALILPGAETLATAGYPSWIARFTDRMITDLSLGLIEPRWAGHFVGARQAGVLLERALPGQDPQVVRQRLSMFIVLAARAFAHLEAQQAHGAKLGAEAIHRTAADLIDMGTVLLGKTD